MAVMPENASAAIAIIMPIFAAVFMKSCLRVYFCWVGILIFGIPDVGIPSESLHIVGREFRAALPTDLFSVGIGQGEVPDCAEAHNFRLLGIL